MINLNSGQKVELKSVFGGELKEVSLIPDSIDSYVNQKDCVRWVSFPMVAAVELRYECGTVEKYETFNYFDCSPNSVQNIIDSLSDMGKDGDIKYFTVGKHKFRLSSIWHSTELQMAYGFTHKGNNANILHS